MALRRWIGIWALATVALLLASHLAVGLTGWSPWPEPTPTPPSHGVPARNLSTPMVIT